MIEGTYEDENGCTTLVLRQEEYWSNLSGATGQIYGNAFIWPFRDGWKKRLDSPGAGQMAYVKTLFESRPWHELIPDQDHTSVTEGYGTLNPPSKGANPYATKSDYVAASRTPDGKLLMAYMPSLRTLTVDMTKLRGSAKAQWFDPSRGTFVVLDGSPFPNAGKRSFTPVGKNGDGDGDWVLILESGASAP
jgi:hypothetical protein